MTRLRDRIFSWLKSQPHGFYTLEQITKGIRHNNKESVRKKLYLLRKQGKIGHIRPRLYFLKEEFVEKKSSKKVSHLEVCPPQGVPLSGVPKNDSLREKLSSELGKKLLPWFSEPGRFHNIHIIGYNVPGVVGQGKYDLDLSFLHSGAIATLIFHKNGTTEVWLKCKRPGFSSGKNGTLRIAFGTVRSILSIMAGREAYNEWPNFIVERFEVRNSRHMFYTGGDVLLEVFTGKVFLHAYRDVDPDGKPTLETEVWFRGTEVSIDEVLASAYVTKDFMTAMKHIADIKKQTIGYLANAVLRDQELLENTGKLRLVAEELSRSNEAVKQRLTQVLMEVNELGMHVSTQERILQQTTNALENTSEALLNTTAILSRVEGKIHSISETIKPVRLRVLDLIRANGGMTIQDLVIHTGLNYQKLWRELTKLTREGVLRRVLIRHGRGRPKSFYEVIRNEES